MNPETKLHKLQSTTYLSKRLTKRQKAVLKKSGMGEDGQEESDSYAGETEIVLPPIQSYSSRAQPEPLQNSNNNLSVQVNARGHRKKLKKNILTVEEKAKKNEAEEKRRAHLARANEEHKQHIVNKILNENKKNKAAVLTEYGKKIIARKTMLEQRKFATTDVVIKYSSSSAGTWVKFPGRLTLEKIIHEQFDAGRSGS